MPYNDVVLSQSAFFHIIVSVIEVYKREAIGILVGTSKYSQHTCHVKYAVSQQTSERKFTWSQLTESYPRMEKTVAEMNRTFKTRNKIVGYFHSHTDWGPYIAPAEPSKADLVSLTENDIEVIVAIREAKRTLQWDLRSRKGKISGTIGNFHIELVCYRLLGSRFTYLPVFVGT